MAGKVKTVGTVIKYGPLVAAAVQKYGPQVWEQVKSQREPAEKFVQAKVAKGNQRKKALAHAATVRSGAVLRVFHDHESHWVVFTGDKPIAVHPPTRASFEVLLADADLDKRVTPAQARTMGWPRRGRGGKDPVPAAGAASGAGAGEESAPPEETDGPGASAESTATQPSTQSDDA